MPTRGYTSATSALPRDRLDLHLSASRAGAVNVRFERYGFGMMAESADVTVGAHAEPASAWLGFGWPVAHTLVVPAPWPSGLYVVHARGPGDGGHAPVADFVVRAATPGATARTLLATDFITMQAYTDSGGRSLYDGRFPREPKVSFDRAFVDVEHARSKALIVWLRDNGYAVEHASLVDLHTHTTLLDAYDCLIFGPHAEYWSKEMRDRVERFVRNGGNVLSLSGNTCYRQIRFERGTRVLVGYKNALADPEPDLERASVAFAQPPVHRPPNAMLGVGFTYGAWAGPDARYQLHFPSHWVRAGVTATETEPFLSYETDATQFVMEDEGYPRVTGDEQTPLSTVVLASADLGMWSGKPGMATATLYVRHGMVFSAGTTEWVARLAAGGAIARMTRNVLDRFSRRRPFGWEDIGHANSVTALAAFEDVLYASTSDNRLWRRHPVLAEVPWRSLGHANGVIAMAADLGSLYAITSDNRLWWRTFAGSDVPWTILGSGPPGGTRALSASGGALFAVGTDGVLRWRAANRQRDLRWDTASVLPANTTITAMTSYNGVLFAATSTNRLLRSSFDFVRESRAWIDIHHCNGARGLAVVDGMLFVATGEHRLWWMDLRHRDLDAASAERR